MTTVQNTAPALHSSDSRARSFFARVLQRCLFFVMRRQIKQFSPVAPGLCVANLFFQRVLGINSQMPWMVHFTSRVTGDISIGENVWKSFAISGGCYIQGINGVVIGDDSLFAPNVSIVSANHVKGDHSQWEKCEPIRIGERCWIGTGATILAGVQLGNDVTVGAGAVVTKDFPDHAVIGGVPARLLQDGGDSV